ncbi:DEAD/DEAH box helicase [Pontiella sulfatireligans]|uniref:ATP-dependent RNA helicase RhlB n=1 Tax=Pontiella sulfatireligans TaxID=2750658 RepID=A0A6C2UUK1_9BACT|nr:DEAD/DEAH box helicase [Pontiella sulfatireligans]VGO22566.1 ATP-dependent RNA helicase RhlB [Pontiella sulfatireligans]
MSLIKKIASVFGKKDEPKPKEAPKQQKTTPKNTTPGQEEWRPGDKSKPRPQPPRRKPPGSSRQQENDEGPKRKGRKSDGRKSDGRKSDGRKSDGRTSEGRKNSLPRPKKTVDEPFVLTAEEQERMKEFRPEEEDRRVAYEKRLRQRRKDQVSGKPPRDRSRKPRPEGERKPRSEGERKPRPQREREPREENQFKPLPKQEPKARAEETPWDAAEFTIEPEEGKIRFHDLGLHPRLMRGIHALGWQYATPIQGEILPGTLKGRDMAGRAQTGTGKTAAFLISIINHCLNNPLEKQGTGCPRALIIAPTRELAMQIASDSEGLNQFTGLHTVVLYGGMDYNKQQRELEDNQIDIVVATPGRLLDFASKSVVKLNATEIMVIDEADRMLDMGFIPDVRRIIYKTPQKEKRQTVLFSATLSDDVMKLAADWMVDPERIDIEPDQVAVDTVDQKVFIVTDKEKFPLLYNIIKNDNPDRIIIFANRRDQTERLTDELERYSIKCEMLSGAVTQKKRMRILEDFKSGKVKVLVATDVAGRGIHVAGVSHVVNFNIPENPDDYVHRIGRTGRAGSLGKSITFACEMESFELPAIEELLGMELKCTMPPEELLEELPPAPPRKRRPRPEGGASRHGGGRRPQGGNSGGQRRSGGSRPHR